MSSPAQQVMRDIWRDTDPGPMNLRVYPRSVSPDHAVLIEVSIRDDDKPRELHLHGIVAISKGAGRGTNAMRWLCDTLDRYGVEAIMNVKRLGKDGPTAPQLRRWYKSFGFRFGRWTEQWDGRRSPNEVQP